MMKKLLVCILSLLPLLAVAQPVYDCHRTSGKIRIDGRVREKEWAGAVPCAEIPHHDAPALG